MEIDFVISTRPLLPIQGMERLSTSFTEPRQEASEAATGIKGDRAAGGSPASCGSQGEIGFRASDLLVAFENVQPASFVSWFVFFPLLRPAQTGGLVTNCCLGAAFPLLGRGEVHFFG